MKNADEKQEFSSGNMYIIEGMIEEFTINISIINDKSDDKDAAMITIVVEAEE